MYQSEQINELATALSKAQGEIMPAIKDSKNPFFKSNYADLSSVWNACRSALTKNGLAVVQMTDRKDGELILITTLTHASGQWMRSFSPLLNEKNNAQGLGSAITYMRRYALCAIVGVTCDDDDDGNDSGYPGKNEAPKLSYISAAQAHEVKKALATCDPTYVKNVTSYYAAKKISSWDLLNEADYKALMHSIHLQNSQKVAHAA